jgi:GntR family transcriptional regulator
MTARASGRGWLRTAPDFSQGNPLPVHARIEQWLIDTIGRGELATGDQLPREDEFAAQLGVSRMTLRQALSSLQSKGVVSRRTGRRGGTFVTSPAIDCDLTGLVGFTEQMRRSNMRAGARMVSATTVPANNEVANHLGIARGALVHRVVRVRTANRTPLALECSDFPVEHFPDLLEHGLTGSLYSLLSRVYKQRPRTAHETLIPVIASQEDADLLTVEPGSSLLLIERTAYTAAGLAVEYARDRFRPDRVRVSLRTSL